MGVILDINNQIDRLETDKTDIVEALQNKGSSIPSTASYDDIADYITSLPGGGGGEETKTVNIKIIDGIEGFTLNCVKIIDETTNTEYLYNKKNQTGSSYIPDGIIYNFTLNNTHKYRIIPYYCARYSNFTYYELIGCSFDKSYILYDDPNYEFTTVDNLRQLTRFNSGSYFLGNGSSYSGLKSVNPVFFYDNILLIIRSFCNSSANSGRTALERCFYNLNNNTSSYEFDFNLDNLVTNKITTLQYFMAYTYINSLSTNNWDTSSVTDFQRMFANATIYNTYIDMSNWSTASVSSMNFMIDSVRGKFGGVKGFSWESTTVQSTVPLANSFTSSDLTSKHSFTIKENSPLGANANGDMTFIIAGLGYLDVNEMIDSMENAQYTGSYTRTIKISSRVTLTEEQKTRAASYGYTITQ